MPAANSDPIIGAIIRLNNKPKSGKMIKVATSIAPWSTQLDKAAKTSLVASRAPYRKNSNATAQTPLCLKAVSRPAGIGSNRPNARAPNKATMKGSTQPRCLLTHRPYSCYRT